MNSGLILPPGAAGNPTDEQLLAAGRVFFDVCLRRAKAFTVSAPAELGQHPTIQVALGVGIQKLFDAQLALLDRPPTAEDKGAIVLDFSFYQDFAVGIGTGMGAVLFRIDPMLHADLGAVFNLSLKQTLEVSLNREAAANLEKSGTLKPGGLKA